MPTGVWERTPEHWEQINKALAMGRTPEVWAKAAASRVGIPRPKARFNQNGLWKGENVSYAGLHAWVAREKGPAKEQSCSHEDDSCKGRMEWANVSREYKRNLEDFFPLCTSHHKRYDLASIVIG